MTSTTTTAAQERKAETQISCTVVGISGPSSSGKSTIARHLRQIFGDRSFILHQDDFFRPEDQIPKAPGGYTDWDCVEALDLESFRKALEYVKSHGCLPDWLDSKEDTNEIGSSDISQQAMDEIKASYADGIADAHPSDIQRRICFVDGFLLYGPDAVLDVTLNRLDEKLFLPATFEDVKERRGRRSGYVTLEGFWEDPEGYVEDVVWPNYVRYHESLFKDGKPENGLNEQTLKERGIAWYDVAKQRERKDKSASIKLHSDLERCLEWATMNVLRAEQ